jgi:hypothetical protein
MIGHMFEVKDALERMVVNSRWNEYVNTMFNEHNSHRAHTFAGIVGATSVMMDSGNSANILCTCLKQS